MAAADAPAARAAPTPAPRRWLVRGLHLFVLSGFALAQPLLDILGRNADFFAVRGSTPFDVVAFAVGITFVPALVLLVLEMAVALASAAAARALHLVSVAALAGLFAIQAFERAGIGGTGLLVAAASIAAVAAAVAVARLGVVRSFLSVLAPAPLVFAGLFLFASPASDVVFAGETDVEVETVRASAPVIMVVFDELPTISLLGPDGEIDARRYPSFARLARDSTWFRNATTMSASTTLAVPSLLTGNAPRRGRLPLVQDHPRNLFTLLGGRYRLNVSESQTRLCPTELCERDDEDTAARLSSLYDDARVVYLHLVAPPALEERLPAIDEGWGDFGEVEDGAAEFAETTRPKGDIRTFYVGRLRDWERFVASIGLAQGRRPPLHFLHVLLPHGPWLYFPDGRVSAVKTPRAPGRRGETWWDDELARQAYARHLLQLGYTDALLGELIARLEEHDLYARSLVVVTADHGISFRGGDKRRAPTRANLQELAFVPLFLKLPGEGRGRVVDEHVRILDVLPTIADALGAALPWTVDGRSALAADFTGSGTVRVGALSAPFEAMLAARRASLERQVELFGSGSWDLYGWSDRDGLVGRAVDELRPTPAGGTATVDATGSELLRSLPDGARAVPSPLVGTLAGVEEGERLLLALNGRAAGVGRAYAGADGVVRFSLLASPDAFRPGANEARIFVLPAEGVEPLGELQVRLSEE